MDENKLPFSSPAVFRERLQGLNKALLALHKSLLDSERITYEQAFGPIHSPGEFLQLLLNNPWFTWLRPLSQLAAAIDEALDNVKVPVTGDQAVDFFKSAQELLHTNETGHEFGTHYFEALQRDPDVVLAHADVVKFIKSSRATTS